jgi:hypothetical protein
MAFGRSYNKHLRYTDTPRQQEFRHLIANGVADFPLFANENIINMMTIISRAEDENDEEDSPTGSVTEGTLKIRHLQVSIVV